jgi:hypothetical protein
LADVTRLVPVHIGLSKANEASLNVFGVVKKYLEVKQVLILIQTHLGLSKLFIGYV